MDKIWTDTLARLGDLEKRMARIEELARQPLAEMEAKAEPESSPEIQDHINSIPKPEPADPVEPPQATPADRPGIKPFTKPESEVDTVDLSNPDALNPEKNQN